MKLIVGLGNPGIKYENTRHNLGACVIKEIVKKYDVRLKLNRSLKSRVAKINIAGSECLLVIPDIFMNLSGEAVKLLFSLQGITLRDLLVIHDDIDLELGTARFKKDGGSGGHKGIKSIIEALGNKGFDRLRLGIGRSSYKEDAVEEYVLSNFSKKEQQGMIKPLLKEAACACEAWVEFGIEKAMNEFN